MGPKRGIGHVMRSLALAEELRRRGAEVVFVCDSPTVPWADEQISARGIGVEPAVWTADEHLELFARLGLDAVVFDSYDLDAEVFTAVRKSGIPTLAIVDGDLRGAEADVFVDQNLGSELDQPVLPEGSTRLAGLDYVLLRDEILQLRPTEPPQPRSGAVPKVFAFFGGTDAFGAGPYVVRALARTGVGFEALVVAPGDDLADAIAAVDLDPGQHVEVIGPTSELAKAVVASDLVLSASGTSTWELLCLGATAGLVCVVDNQVMGYERTVATGAAVGVGVLSDLKVDPDPAAAVLRPLLRDAEERARIAGEGWKLVDGQGRSRVADALFHLIS
ncbi:spore coat polysaccharide biosynthesis predicted glycosyltransferase SpsG [Kribbella sp. VKM Ac-2527]|uniref:Spore coat polysaccharide biosynthesis predicted glycosyltransferase SpsG n=1 Tax=Kribbella caucasensis TaxID=2512215 RepID=A0A4R6JMC1_9ACTN|nr:spore coat polysaccharide biosynthesis predicted glycosyltransferase SpsG [Kribbella sp. VKM Ac-2527]